MPLLLDSYESARSIPLTSMTRGPFAWRNHRGSAADARERSEGVLYSDADLSGSILDGLGPYSLMNALPPRSGELQPCVVIRANCHLSAPELLVGEAEDGHRELAPTDETAYHGGDDLDELAALLSLCLGARFRSGGITRLWGIGEEDSLGLPVYFNHRPPYLPREGRQGALIPGLAGPRDLADALPYLKKYFDADATTAVAIVRAARSYQQAVWVADDDPTQAWIQLVSALEVAAESWRGAKASPTERLASAMPELVALLEPYGSAHTDAVATLLAPLAKSQARFLGFAAEFGPGPVEPRTYEWAQVDWAKVPDALRTIYSYRSRALHAGTPFPIPMCHPPRTNEDSRMIERPDGLSTSASDAIWMADDTPMLLWVFEHITREALKSWWAQAQPSPVVEASS